MASQAQHRASGGLQWNPAVWDNPAMRFSTISLIAALSLCAIAFGQAAAPPSSPQTFHLRGTVTDPLGAVIPGVEVTFSSQQLTKRTTASATGQYDSDLPFGGYTMTAERKHFRTYRRPLFLVESPLSLTFDISLPLGKIVDRVVVGKLDQPFNYYGEEFLPAPSKDGVPFQLYVRYTKRASNGNTLDYSGENNPHEDSVFVAYNLFSLRADHVIFDVERKTLRASGSVVVSDGTGTTQRAESIDLSIENGRTTPLR
jgi:Carboxypeptidase regulatory-like domain